MPHDAAPVPPAAVAITRLTLAEFRNYATLRLDVAPQPVVLTGQNGAGKTNLLEALSLLAPGRGIRRAHLSDLVRRDEGATEVPGRAWAVAVHLHTPSGEVDLGTGLVPAAPANADTDADEEPAAPERRTVRIDGRTARGPAALSGLLAVRWLSPLMDRLFVDSAGGRRRFLDHLTSGLDPAHTSRVAAYERSLRERARLLREKTGDDHWLAALEMTLAELGVAIAAARREYVGRLSTAIASEGVTKLSLAIDGTVEAALGEGPALAAESKFRDALTQSRAHDAITGGSATGPHRSDLLVTHASGLGAAQCSTGEQKALLLAIVRADVRLLAQAQGRPPLLLLDEVAAHLDERRRRELFEAVLACGAQVWATGTDRALFRALEGRAQFFSVVRGQIAQASALAARRQE